MVVVVEENDCDEGAASSTDRENEAASRVMDGTALTAVSEASASDSEDELRLVSWILQSRRPRSSAKRLHSLVPTIIIDGAALYTVSFARATDREAELRIVVDSGAAEGANVHAAAAVGVDGIVGNAMLVIILSRFC